MIRRILLLSLPAILEPGDDYLQDGHSFHLGLAYMAAVLRHQGLEIHILDCFAEAPTRLRPSADSSWLEYGLSDEDILSRIDALRPDLIGMTIPFSCQHYLGQNLARQIKAHFPEVILVAGGNHVSAVPEQMDRAAIDYLILGEGEYALATLIQALNEGQPIETVGGAERGIPRCLRAQPIQDLDRLPFPALDLLPLSKLWAGGYRWMIMVATRGCCYHCNFCSIHTIMGRHVRRRSIENVLAEIEHWKKTYRIQEIYFEDDNLTVDTAWAKELFRRIAEGRYGIRLHARNGIRADTIDRELLQLMKKAGFQDFMIAPESGSQKTLDVVIGKRMRMEDSVQAVQLAHALNLGINLFFVIGFPGETWEDIQATMAYARRLKRLGGVGVWISLASPYPGTRLFAEAAEKNLLSPAFDYRRCRTVDYQLVNPNYTAAELKAFRAQAMTELNSPRHPLSALGNALRLLVTDPVFFFSKLRYKLGR